MVVPGRRSPELLGAARRRRVPVGCQPAALQNAGRRAPPPRAGPVAVLVTDTAGPVLVTVASGQPTAAAPRPPLGGLAAVGYAATTVLSRHVAQRVPPRELTTLSPAGGALTLAPLADASGLAMPLEPVPLAMLLHFGVGTPTRRGQVHDALGTAVAALRDPEPDGCVTCASAARMQASPEGRRAG
jgi:hypothetical protein